MAITPAILPGVDPGINSAIQNQSIPSTPTSSVPTTPTELPPIIPDAGVYGAQTAAATNAYNNAITQAMAQRNALYNQYGLNSQGSVDPNNPYGQYQQMLGAQAGQQQFDTENAAARGLSGGLAHQQGMQDQRANNNQDWQFQNQVGQVATDYASTAQNALSTRDSSISQAYSNAMQVALQNMLAQLQAGVYDAPKSKKGA